MERLDHEATQRRAQMREIAVGPCGNLQHVAILPPQELVDGGASFRERPPLARRQGEAAFTARGHGLKRIALLQLIGAQQGTYEQRWHMIDARGTIATVGTSAAVATPWLIPLEDTPPYTGV